MARWQHRGKTPDRASVEGHVDAIEHRAGGCGRRLPGALARDRVGVETTAAAGNDLAHGADVDGVVADRELVVGRVTRVHVLEQAEELGIVTQRAGNGANPAKVLGMPPTGVVDAGVGTRDKRDGHSGWWDGGTVGR